MTQNSTKIIGWEKWRDPFGGDDVISLRELLERFMFIKSERIDDIFDTDTLEKKISLAEHKIPIIATPMGLVPVTQYTKPSENFNFWIMHTNFKITSEVLDALVNKIPGIEAVDVYTPYRARIAFGKLFDSAQVKQTIQNFFGCSVNKEIEE
jgi:hypothetical protein